MLASLREASHLKTFLWLQLQFKQVSLKFWERFVMAYFIPDGQQNRLLPRIEREPGYQKLHLL